MLPGLCALNVGVKGLPRLEAPATSNHAQFRDIQSPGEGLVFCPPFALFAGYLQVCVLRVPQKEGMRKEPKPKLFGPDIFGWGGVSST